MLPFLRSDLAQFTAYTPHTVNPLEQAESDQVIDRLDTNESPFDLPPELKQKLAWSYQQLIESNRYPDGGHDLLKRTIAEYVNESAQTHSVTEAAISVGNGSDELIRSLLIATCLGGEGSVLVADPTFSMYAILAQTLGIPVVRVGRSEANFEIDLNAAAQAIAETDNPPIRVVFVVHPNSPTANALTADELNWLRSLPEQILVVIDEAYFEFSQTSIVAELPQHPNWIVLRTFSKAFRLAAHRVGYCVAHPLLAATLEKIRLPYNLPSFTQAAAQLALAHRQTLLSAIPVLLAERSRLVDELSNLSSLRVWASDANFIFVRLKEADTSAHTRLTQLHQTLKTQGTLIKLISNGLRITVGTPEENQRTLTRLQAALS